MDQENPSRRAVLRGVLAAACGMWLPTIISGCDTKQSANSGTPGSPGTSGSPAPGAGMKVTQASVQYQTQPKGEQKCSNCANFIAESNSCKLVEGQISPEGWCRLWAKKI